MMEKSFFDQPVKNNLKTSHSSQNIATGTGKEDGYTTGFLLH